MSPLRSIFSIKLLSVGFLIGDQGVPPRKAGQKYRAPGENFGARRGLEGPGLGQLRLQHGGAEVLLLGRLPGNIFGKSLKKSGGPPSVWP